MVGATYAPAAIIGRTGKEALARLRSEQLAGRIADAGQLTLITSGTRAGEYMVPVRLIIREQPRAPRWTKVAIVTGGILVFVSVFVGLAIWTLLTLSPVSLTVLLSSVLVVFLAWLRAKYARSASVTVTTTTTVRMRR